MGTPNDRAQLHPDANKALGENLAPGEDVAVIIRGVYDSAMIATDRRVFVFKKGFFSGVAMGRRLASFDFANLTGVQQEQGLMNGFVALQGPGIDSIDGGFWSTGKNDPMKVPHAIATNASHKDQARQGSATLRRLISERQDAGRAGVAPAPDPIDQLRKLGELRDAGVLTASEFEAKKAELLARM